MRAIPVVAAIALASLIAPAVAAAAAPGVEQYTVRALDAAAKKYVSTAPVAHPEDLPKSVRDSLAKQPDGAALAQIATARELGAPDPSGQGAPGTSGSEDPASDGGESRSAPAAAVHSLGAPGLILILAALAGIAALVYTKRRGTTGSG